MSLVGRRFAYRERPRTLGYPVRPVEVVKEGPPRTQKVRIRWLDGEYEGLEEWVPKVRLVVPWEEVEAFLEDERRLIQLLDNDPDDDDIKYEAVKHVFLANPVGGVFLGNTDIRYSVLIIYDFEDTAAALGLNARDLLSEPFAFVDRKGRYVAPFRVAERVARHICTRFPRDVLADINKWEEEIKQAVVSGYYESEYISYPISPVKAKEWLDSKSPVFRLIRSWCGDEACKEFDELLALRNEVQRLRKILESTIQWMRAVGHKQKAAYLQRELNRVNISDSSSSGS